MALFISTGEIVFLLFAVLMLFGVDRLPEFARTAGKAIRSVKNAANDIKSEIANATPEDVDPSKAIKKITKEVENSIKRGL
ncbi:MAG: twin-arginine translocase TatA/TatE family subunit [Schleiferiaceae bacterium]|jgi:sec-independent protein translocase protein TatA|nr:twin-arginine translocase TatA/TatE family subunit [Flavobacteriales bacterium]MDO7567126.1 twin-arginine translocase TatA/TatE family subunit [Schleiferiaceae bacterium]MDO7583758.1 twin-arginine translocase TatA/TatE family subunit [Schleiferiaceae bacterium]MDO7592794.1 twin-arginine translocase TatA/TatE family subunit [Schleiferiaceae bacterium]MDO7601814.1 twin-arginine translocase TatA/TatE family subunit [Schleiferiaceae bacterium]